MHEGDGLVAGVEGQGDGTVALSFRRSRNVKERVIGVLLFLSVLFQIRNQFQEL